MSNCPRCGQSENSEKIADEWTRLAMQGKIVKKAKYDAVVRERDEWKQEHENLLAVRQQDIAALTAKIERLEATHHE